MNQPSGVRVDTFKSKLNNYEIKQMCGKEHLEDAS